MSDIDVIVIGGGIAGISTAFRLAGLDRSVLVLEKSSIGFEASSRNAGGVRQMFRDPREVPLARFSIEIWKQLHDELGEDVEYRQNGCIRLALEDEEVAPLREAQVKDVAAGIPVELLEPDEVAALIPVNPARVKLASYCALDGHANPVKACAAFGRAARRAGVEVREGVSVRTVRQAGAGFEVGTDAGSFTARQVLLAAGPWTSTFLLQLGIDVPMTLRRPQMAETVATEVFLKPFVGLGNLRGYGRQTIEGRMNIGIRNLDAELESPEPTHELVRQATRLWSGIFPQLEELEITRTWSGFTVRPPDECPMLGAVPGIEGLFIASGFSGHGFAVGPGVGHVMADLITGRPPAVDVGALGIGRFL